MVGIENSTETAPEVWIIGQTLYINNNVSETIAIYSTSGILLYKIHKGVGRETFHVGDFSKGILIVKGSSGWVKKCVIR